MGTRDLALVAVIIALGSVVQGISGFGFALVTMPLLSALLGVERALAIETILGIVSNATTAWTARTDILRPTAARLLGATVVGMPIGWFILEHVAAKPLKLMVGAVVGVLAVLLAFHVRITATGLGVDLVSGFFSGVLATSTGTNGPPLVIGLSGRRLPAAQQRATLSTVFTIGNVFVLGLLLSSGRVTRLVLEGAAVALPGMMLAWWLGDRLFARLDQHRYERLVIILLLASAAVAIISALLR